MKVALRETASEMSFRDDVDVELFEDGYMSIFKYERIGTKINTEFMLLRPDEVQKLKELLNDSPASV